MQIVPSKRSQSSIWRRPQWRHQSGVPPPVWYWRRLISSFPGLASRTLAGLAISICVLEALPGNLDSPGRICFQSWGRLKDMIDHHVRLIKLKIKDSSLVHLVLRNQIFRIWSRLAIVFHVRYSTIETCWNIWLDSLRPINNLSVKQGRVFLGWTSTKQG